MSYGIAAVILHTEIEQSLLEKLCKVTFACGLLGSFPYEFVTLCHLKAVSVASVLVLALGGWRGCHCSAAALCVPQCWDL